ncbi:MAG: hypothetical protein ACTSPV_15360 [Candidatus Hodarchaeales archaeon]
MQWGIYHISNVRWDTYSEKISEYGRETLQGRYGSSDREMIVRNNDLVRVDLTDEDTDWYDLRDARYFMPIMPDNDQGLINSKNLLDNVGYDTQQLPTGMTDGNAGPYLGCDDWGEDGWANGQSYPEAAKIIFDNVQDLSGVLLYVGATNPLRVAKVVLKDQNDEILLNRYYNLPAPIRVGEDKTKSSTLRPPQPMWMALPEKLAQGVKEVHVYGVRVWKTDPNNSFGGCWCEVKVFGQGENWEDGTGKPEIYLPQSVEFIERAPEIDTDPETTNFFDTDDIEYTIISNGDEDFWADEVQRYVSTSNQAGMMMVQIMHSANGEFTGNSAKIKSMRWNFGYTVPVNVVTGYPSRQDKDDYDDAQSMIITLVLTILVTLIFVILLWWLPGQDIMVISTIANVIQKIQMIVMIIETAGAFGRWLAGDDIWDFQYKKVIGDITEAFGLGIAGRLFTDWIVDFEGTAARFVAGDKYNLSKGYWDDSRWWSFADAMGTMNSWNSVVKK